jgi:hypothetical protein
VARKPAEEVQLKLRFDEGLRRRIAKAAERNGCSMNAEIIARLRESFRKDDTAALITRTAKETAHQYMVPLSELGQFSPEEARARWEKRQAGIDPDEGDKS